mmetsp:Transcript_9508/g.14139  ORF Transcript_9508/g.14139 Transcript_9508/m.14139 type:complete len:228 (-) Transcript_9508:1409-2092(-)
MPVVLCPSENPAEIAALAQKQQYCNRILDVASLNAFVTAPSALIDVFIIFSDSMDSASIFSSHSKNIKAIDSFMAGMMICSARRHMSATTSIIMRFCFAVLSDEGSVGESDAKSIGSGYGQTHSLSFPFVGTNEMTFIESSEEVFEEPASSDDDKPTRTTSILEAESSHPATISKLTESQATNFRAPVTTACSRVSLLIGIDFKTVERFAITVSAASAKSTTATRAK